MVYHGARVSSATLSFIEAHLEMHWGSHVAITIQTFDSFQEINAERHNICLMMVEDSPIILGFQNIEI